MSFSFCAARETVSIILIISSLLIGGSESCYGGNPAACPASVCPDANEDLPFTPTPEDTKTPPVFNHLTHIEIQSVLDLMLSSTDETGLNFNISTIEDAREDYTASFIDYMTLITPEKTAVLAHLDNGAAAPDRYAEVAVVHNSYDNNSSQYTSVQELYKVGPLGSSSPMVVTLKEEIHKLRARLTSVEEFYIDKYVIKPFYKRIEHILVESYNVNISSSCAAESNKCLKESFIMPSVDLRNFPPGSTISNQERKTWFFVMRNVEDEILHPLGLQILVNHDPIRDPTQWKVENVWYNFQLFADADQLLKNYHDGNMIKGTLADVTRKPDENLFSSMRRRTPGYDDNSSRGSQFYLPVGRGFSLEYGKISWRKWTLNYNLHPIRGLALFDVRWDNVRIAYEISLQELAVEYSGFSPMDQLTAYLDSREFLGLSTTPLMPGVDCPNHASFVDLTVYSEGDIKTIKKGLCIFEWNNAMPLKRHFYQHFPARFDGMETNSLVVRAIITVYNYDYELDYVFLPSGHIEVKTTLIGYVQADLYHDVKTHDFGLQLAPKLSAALHNHLAHFKVDLDINGISNRYEQWIAEPSDQKIFGMSELGFNSQEIFRRNLVQMETDWHYDFISPTWHLFYKNGIEDELGNNKCWEIAINTPGMNMRKHRGNYRNEKAFSFSFQQLATTIRKESEQSSSSVYNGGCPIDPAVTFTDFFKPNPENLLDGDLVAWVTLGKWHIPRREDLPVVTTPGHTMSFTIKPFNYFKEDPSMKSFQNVHFEQSEDGKEVKTQIYNCASGGTCAAPSIKDAIKSYDFAGIKKPTKPKPVSDADSGKEELFLK